MSVLLVSEKLSEGQIGSKHTLDRSGKRCVFVIAVQYRICFISVSGIGKSRWLLPNYSVYSAPVDKY